MSDSVTPDKQADSFLHRWSRRKREQAQQQATSGVPAERDTPQTVNEPPAAQELPDIDSLHENSEVSMFFTEQVSETLKRKALRKLFHMDKFNFCDGLDDYAEDYTQFEPLGDVLTAHQKMREEREALNRLANSELQDEPENGQNTDQQIQLAEYDEQSSPSEQATSNDATTPVGREQKEGQIDE